VAADGPVGVLLVADDRHGHAQTLAAAFEPLDCTLVRAGSAHEALLALLDKEFAAIVLDIDMPLVNGIELVHIIKQRARTRDIPILFLNDFHADEQDILRGYDAGSIAYLSKPVHPRVLRSKVAAYVELFRKTKALAAANAALSQEVAERIRAEKALSESSLELERRVEERTAELRRAMERESAARIEAEEESRLREEFLAVVSHELRTPLNAIYGWSELLSREGVNAVTRAEGLAAIKRNAKAQSRLIEDLLDMSRITSSKARIDAQPVNLTEVVAAAVQTAQPNAAANGLRLDTLIGSGAQLPAGAWVVGDFGRLQQIIGNLLSNAIKFTPPGGVVTVLVKAAAGEVEVAVQDTGQGIDPKVLPQLFSRFHQADDSTTRRFGGLGLGLSIVRQLVELHDGRVRAQSAGPGRGSRFTVTLPLTEPQQAVTAGPKAVQGTRSEAEGANGAGPASILGGLRILCVDDEPDARQLLRHILEQKQATVALAASVDEALELIGKDEFHVLVSDIGMPGRDGFDLIRSVREREGDGAGVAAIALTAYARQDDREKALDAGFDEHVAKPVDTARLVGMIARLAGEKVSVAPGS
jgi:signal transduction histidine kinase